jgi:hypothetical protein
LKKAFAASRFDNAILQFETGDVKIALPFAVSAAHSRRGGFQHPPQSRCQFTGDLATIPV